jgi:hypothetical protein
VIPFLLDAARERCKVAFDSELARKPAVPTRPSPRQGQNGNSPAASALGRADANHAEVLKGRLNTTRSDAQPSLQDSAEDDADRGPGLKSLGYSQPSLRDEDHTDLDGDEGVLDPTVWRLLRDDPDRYLYPAMKLGVVDAQGNVLPESALPDFVQRGMDDPKERMFDRRYNLTEADLRDEQGNKLTLPTETWREYVERRKRCLELRAKLAAGEVREVNDLITYNLDLRQFAQDVIENCEGPDLLRAIWKAVQNVTVLDPTCGSGAFLFAALNILEPLYEACLDRMQAFLDEHDRADPSRPGQLFSGAQNRLTIAVSGHRSASSRVFSTRYHRWDARGGERDSLFGAMTYASLSDLAGQFHGLFPKAGSAHAASVLKKLDHPRPLGAALAAAGGSAVYWVRVPGYFCQFSLDPPMARPEKGGGARIRGEVNSVAAPDGPTSRALHALLNSSTYYQFYCAYSDGRHINPSDVRDFPVDLACLVRVLGRPLADLSSRLELCMKANTTQWRKSGLLIDSVDSKACKPLLDQIDCLLARHYGFTDEELDFIINYDVKYRMGREGREED